MTSKFKCTECGEVHDSWPALAFASPTGYHQLSEEEKKEIGELSSDFCIVRYEDQTDRFVRATLSIQVNDHCEDLDYGVWVSLSEKSFDDYKQNFGDSAEPTEYFGWLCNNISGYPEGTLSVPTTVRTRTDGFRPEIIPHHDFDHSIVRDYYNGITKAEAESRIKDMFEAIDKSRFDSSGE